MTRANGKKRAEWLKTARKKGRIWFHLSFRRCVFRSFVVVVRALKGEQKSTHQLLQNKHSKVERQQWQQQTTNDCTSRSSQIDYIIHAKPKRKNQINAKYIPIICNNLSHEIRFLFSSLPLFRCQRQEKLSWLSEGACCCFTMIIDLIKFFVTI